MSTLLEIVTKHCQRNGLPVPAAILGSVDPQVIQMYSLLEEGCEAIATRGQWEELVSEATWTTVALEDQGEMSTIAPGFESLLIRTIWDRTLNLPLWGPNSPQDWQELKGLFIDGPTYTFRIRESHLLVNPVPPAGSTWAFEYMDLRYIYDPVNAVRLESFTLDTNEVLLPQRVVTLDLRWRWKKEKGLPYAEDFNIFENACVDAIARSGGTKVISMNSDSRRGSPGIFIPSGSWVVP